MVRFRPWQVTASGERKQPTQWAKVDEVPQAEAKESETMLKPTERMQRILAANEKTLARIDAVLEGTDTTTGERKANTETCTYQEAARRLRISRPSIYRLAREGRLTVVPLCGVNRILVQSIEDLVTGARKVDQVAAATVREMGAARLAKRASTIAKKGGER